MVETMPRQNMVTGKGPENYVFPVNGIISSKFWESDILKAAVSNYVIGKNVTNEQYHFGAGDFATDAWDNGTIFNITGFTGSGTITMVKKDEGLYIEIFNITSLTSGTLGKEVFGKKNYPKSYVREDDSITPFGNISQTFQLFVPNFLLP